jgi:hypothetical protein
LYQTTGNSCPALTDCRQQQPNKGVLMAVEIIKLDAPSATVGGGEGGGCCGGSCGCSNK